MRIPGRKVIERTGVDNWTDITRNIVTMRWWPAGIAGSGGGRYREWNTGVGGFSFPEALVEGGLALELSFWVPKQLFALTPPGASVSSQRRWLLGLSHH